VGIATPPDAATELDARVAEACRVTHATREAIAAASAVAMVISQGVAGRDFDGAIPAALNAAEAGTRLGAAVGEADMAGRIVAALAVAGQGEEALLAVTGNSVASRESIPAAFGIVRLAGGDPWRAALIAANFGDDTDTIGSIACAMAGACGGIAAFPPDKVAQVMAANGLDLAPVVTGLLGLRAARMVQPQGAAL
jgi:ADP-ribosylglycohydrolase